MASTKRTDRERERDSVLISELYCKGLSLAAIAKQVAELNYAGRPGFKLTRQQIHSDVRGMRSDWNKSIKDNLDFARAEQLAKLDLVEREAWRGWDKSIGSRQKQRTAKKSGIQNGESVDVSSAELIKEDGLGDPRYLQTVKECIHRRCELLGLDAPQQVEGSFTIKLPADFPAAVPAGD